MIDPVLVVNKPFVVQRGLPVIVESNQTAAYFGEWAVVMLQSADGEPAELRVPFESALENGLIACVNMEDAPVGDDD